MDWSVVQKSSVLNNKSIFDPDFSDKDCLFPQKQGAEYLRSAHKAMGSYVFANQYLNKIIPDDARTFKKEWIKYYEFIPERVNTFIFVDPALSESATSDYTGIVVTHVDVNNRRYISFAKRYKINPTQVVNLLFDLYDLYKPVTIGIEDVAYQKALIYFTAEEMRRRNKFLPVEPVKPPTEKSKETKILGLVPYFEYGNIFLKKGLEDFESELLSFPRGSHDDLIDAAASIISFAYPIEKEKPNLIPPAPNSPNYEAWYIQNFAKIKDGQQSSTGGSYYGYDNASPSDGDGSGSY